MLTLEEVLIVCHELRKRGYVHAFYFGTDREGFTVRASKHPPLSERWWAQPYIEIREACDLAQYVSQG